MNIIAFKKTIYCYDKNGYITKEGYSTYLAVILAPRGAHL